MNARHFLRFIAGIMLLVVISDGRCAVTVDSGEGLTTEGIHPCAMILEGKPAIAYTDGRSGTAGLLKFVRARDAAGTAWEAPIVVDTFVDVDTFGASKVTLLMVNGNPAICYGDRLRATKYVRSVNPGGTVWGTPVYFYANGFAQPDTSMEIVDGKPAVCFTGAPGGASMFVRALDDNGTSWGQPVNISPGSAFGEISMKIVQGRPAIAGVNSSGLWYVQSTDSAGMAWGPPVSVAAWQNEFLRVRPVMQIVDGRPAISYFNTKTYAASYVRAANAGGTAWNPAVRVDQNPYAGFSSLAVMQGKPAIAFTDQDAGLKYVQATDSAGDTAATWGAPVIVNNSMTMRLFLFEVSGRPALAWHDFKGHTLMYTRAVNDGGTALWPAVPRIEDQNGNHVPDGSSQSFGSVNTGTSARLTFTLKNSFSGSAPLVVEGVTFEGADAAEFTLTVPPSTPVAPASSTTFTVQYAPVSPGEKSALLHFATNAEAPLDSYDIILTGVTIPDIVVEGPAGNILTDGGEMTFPIPNAGSTTELVFNVRNPGSAELNGLTVSFDGPNADEFALTGFLSPASPGGSTAFTVRHTPATAGSKSASLHLASNVKGTRNPFDLTLHTAPGLRDASFHPDSGVVWDLAVQGDGKILAGGTESLRRINPGGSFDNSFFSPPIIGGDVLCIAVQKDGMILIGGDFEKVGGRTRAGLARLYPDGILDEGFAPRFNKKVNCLALQPDGAILAGGDFTTLGDEPHLRLARLHPDGTADPSFRPEPDDDVNSLLLSPGGKILIGGNFNYLGKRQVPHIARLHSDGTPDESFAPSLEYGLSALAVRPDGKILALVNGGVRFVLLTDSGLTDHTVAFDGEVLDLVLQADGRFLMTGRLRDNGPQFVYNVFRFNPQGTLDTGFNPEVDVNGYVQRLFLQADGKVLVTGSFRSADGESLQLKRLHNDFAFSLLKKGSASTIRWLRGGSVPEVRDVTFDVKPEGFANWTRLGTAHRIPNGWELSGLTLPSAGQIRAQAYAGGSVMESVAPLLTPLESWRMQFFNTSDNTGDAADDADPDRDGLTNFTEFAFGLSPVDRNGGTLPEFKYVNESFSATFTAPEGREIVHFGAEWSSTMLPGSWTAVPDSGTEGTHVFSVSGQAEKRFVRFVLQKR